MTYYYLLKQKLPTSAGFSFSTVKITWFSLFYVIILFKNLLSDTKGSWKSSSWSPGSCDGPLSPPSDISPPRNEINRFNHEKNQKTAFKKFKP